MQYLIEETLVLDANILRDATLQKMELHHFEAYIHASAIAWTVAFNELRTLANIKMREHGQGVGTTKHGHVNPMEINEMYEGLWEMGTLLQTPNALKVLDNEYKPWKRPRSRGLELTELYRKCDESIVERKASLRDYKKESEDFHAYTERLMEVLHLLGEGIHDSLTRTMGDFLDATDGTKANSKLNSNEKARCEHLLSHNNDSERPFAVMKAIKHTYPSMKLLCLSQLAHARVNGTYRNPKGPGKHYGGREKQITKGVRRICNNGTPKNAGGDLCTMQHSQGKKRR